MPFVLFVYTSLSISSVACLGLRTDHRQYSSHQHWAADPSLIDVVDVDGDDDVVDDDGDNVAHHRYWK